MRGNWYDPNIIQILNTWPSLLTVLKHLLMDSWLHWHKRHWQNVFVRINGKGNLLVYLHFPRILRRSETAPVMTALESERSLIHSGTSKSIAWWRRVLSVTQEQSDASKRGSYFISKCAWRRGLDWILRQEEMEWTRLHWLDLHLVFVPRRFTVGLICMAVWCWKKMYKVNFSGLCFVTHTRPAPALHTLNKPVYLLLLKQVRGGPPHIPTPRQSINLNLNTIYQIRSLGFELWAPGCVVNCAGSECERLKSSLEADSHNHNLGEMSPSFSPSFSPL